MLNLEEDAVAQHGHLVEEKEHSHSYEDRFIALSWNQYACCWKKRKTTKKCNILNPGSHLQERMDPQDLMVLTSLQTGKWFDLYFSIGHTWRGSDEKKKHSLSSHPQLGQTIWLVMHTRYGIKLSSSIHLHSWGKSHERQTKGTMVRICHVDAFADLVTMTDINSRIWFNSHW